MATLAKPYGGQAQTAWPESPATIQKCKNLYGTAGLRPINGAHSLADVTSYRAVTADAVLRSGDICTVTSNKVLRTAAGTPAGSEGVVLSGDGGTIPRYVWSHGDFTAPSSVTAADVGRCIDITFVEMLMRIYHATRASAVGSGLTFAANMSNTSGVYYEYGIAEQGTTSKSYFPVLDLANQDDTNGSFKPVTMGEGFAIASIYGAVWTRATGNA